MVVFLFKSTYRIDLANIVRRRGYKVIRELLANSAETDVDESNAEKQSIAEHGVAIADPQDMVAGQFTFCPFERGFFFFFYNVTIT